MGCWNETCLISNLPIFWGDEVALIPITKCNRDLPTHNFCDSTALYKPHPLILFGNYNDYGIIENVFGDIDQFKQLVDFFVEKTEIMKQKEDSEIEKYIRYIERENIEKLGFVLIHKQIYDEMLKTNYIIDDDKVERINEYLNTNVQMNRCIKIFPYFKPSVLENLKLKHGINYNIDSVFNILKINCNMQLLRKTWMPQPGSGSQNGIEDIHKNIYNIVVDKINKYFEKHYD